MWTIEVSEDASEEEVNQAILKELDFDYIRECIMKLNGIIEKYGPLTEVKEQTEDSNATVFTKIYHEKRGWICDELETVDPLRVWTLSGDPVNGYSYLSNGYYLNDDKPSRHQTKAWYIAEKCFEKVDDTFFTIDTEFIIWQETTDAEEDGDPFYVIDIWELIDSDDLSNEAILGALSDLYFF